MAGQRGGLPLPLLLLSLAGLAVLHLALGTTDRDVTATVPLTLPTSLAPMETSALLPTTASTTTGTIPPSSPETGTSTPERSSTSLGTGSASSPTAPTPTAASAEPSTAPAETTATSDTSTGLSHTPSQPVGTMSRTTPGISTVTVGPALGTSTVPETSSAATGMEPSSLSADSAQTPEVTLSTPADLPVTLPVCPTATSNTSASHLFLSLRLTVPLDLGNTTVQELVLSKLHGHLQTKFPCAGLALEWRGKRRT
ncbi:integumentary mucin A.1-like isoform X2 [Nyctibius grandis]|uniref:integumentary mucin A.1-like isoform X2 n=1 Tax=Nyctibius grandis TaxID=48427 RepID=UPI0035BC1C38